jgi:hypothetical protein
MWSQPYILASGSWLLTPVLWILFSDFCFYPSQTSQGEFMYKQIASLLLVAAIICTLGGSSGLAQTSSLPDTIQNKENSLPDSALAEKREAQQKSSLKAEVAKLVADAKAGKRLTVTNPQNQPAQSNSLSKGWKIGIVVIVALVIVTFVAIHVSHHLFD